MRPVEVDYFSLHNRKPKEIHIEMLDYDFVNKCSDVDELKGILHLLRSGKEGRYPDLERHTEKRLLCVLPESESKKIEMMQKGPTCHEVAKETEDLQSWTRTMQQKQEQRHAEGRSSRRMPPVRGQNDPQDHEDDDEDDDEYVGEDEMPQEKGTAKEETGSR